MLKDLYYVASLRAIQANIVLASSDIGYNAETTLYNVK